MPSESLFINCKNCGKSVPKSTIKCPSCGKIVKKLSAIHWVFIIIGGLIVLGIINSPEKPAENKIHVTSPQEIKNSIKDSLKLEYSWKKEGFGTVMEADLKIMNNSQSDVKDIEIQCDHYSKSETKIDSNNRTIYEIFKASSARSFPNYNMGFIHEQAVSSSCYIKNFSLVNQK